MLIGIDGNEANVNKRVGIGEYCFQIIKFLNKSQSSNRKFRIYLKQSPMPHMPEEGKFWEYRVLKPGMLWTQWRLPLDLMIKKPSPDIIFSPTHYAPRMSPMPSVISVMDLSYLYFPELFDRADLYQLKSWTKYSVKRAKKIFTISNSSKNDIIKEYKVASDKVIVTYPGIKLDGDNMKTGAGIKQLAGKYKISENFILFVGTLQPRKNIARLIEAFSNLIRSKELKTKKFQDLELVIVGKKGWLYEEIINAPHAFGIEDRVKFLENVNDEDLSVFYRNAKCFVMPSLYEGFGLPVLEAMKGNCPVITSNTSSLPEAGGDACLYVDPEDQVDIADKISLLLTDDNLRNSLIEKGKKQVKKFNWEKTARETLAVLEEVAKGNS